MRRLEVIGHVLLPRYLIKTWLKLLLGPGGPIYLCLDFQLSSTIRKPRYFPEVLQPPSTTSNLSIYNLTASPSKFTMKSSIISTALCVLAWVGHAVARPAWTASSSSISAPTDSDLDTIWGDDPAGERSSCRSCRVKRRADPDCRCDRGKPHGGWYPCGSLPTCKECQIPCNKSDCPP